MFIYSVWVCHIFCGVLVMTNMINARLKGLDTLSWLKCSSEIIVFKNDQQKLVPTLVCNTTLYDWLKQKSSYHFLNQSENQNQS